MAEELDRSRTEKYNKETKTLFRIEDLDFIKGDWNDFIDAVKDQLKFYQHELDLCRQIVRAYPVFGDLKDNEEKLDSEIELEAKKNTLKTVLNSEAPDNLVEIMYDFIAFKAPSYLEYLWKQKKLFNSSDASADGFFLQKVSEVRDILEQAYKVVTRIHLYRRKFNFENLNKIFVSNQDGELSINWDEVEKQEPSYLIKIAIKEKFSKNYQNPVIQKIDGRTWLVGDVLGGPYQLIDGHTTEPLSKEYNSIEITPFNGLIRVGNRSGQGYIDLKGNEILKPEPSGKVPKFYNGCKLVSDGLKVVNVETKKELFNIDSEANHETKVQVFGNIFVISTLESQFGNVKEITYQIRDWDNQEINPGKIQNFFLLTKKYTKVPYRNNRGQDMYAETDLCLTFIIGGKYGLIDTISGKIVREPIYKNIKSFVGNRKLEDGIRIAQEYILLESEDEFELLDENFNEVFTTKFKSLEELKQAYAEKFPDDNR